MSSLARYYRVNAYCNNCGHRAEVRLLRGQASALEDVACPTCGMVGVLELLPWDDEE